MLIIIFIRIAITLTFLILAAGGPYAIIQLRRFIRRYVAAHESLKSRVSVIERQLHITPTENQA